MTLALTLYYELAGVIADVEQGAGFDAVCLATIKRVQQGLGELDAVTSVAATHAQAAELRRRAMVLTDTAQMKTQFPAWLLKELEDSARAMEVAADMLDFYS